MEDPAHDRYRRRMERKVFKTNAIMIASALLILFLVCLEVYFIVSYTFAHPRALEFWVQHFGRPVRSKSLAGQYSKLRLMQLRLCLSDGSDCFRISSNWLVSERWCQRVVLLSHSCEQSTPKYRNIGAQVALWRWKSLRSVKMIMGKGNRSIWYLWCLFICFCGFGGVTGITSSSYFSVLRTTLRPAREQLKCSRDWKRLLTAIYGSRGLWTGRWRIIVVQDSHFDFSDTSRTQKYFVAMEFWTEFLATGSGLLDGECGDIAAAFTHCQDLSSTTVLRISNLRSTKHITSIPEMRKVIGKPIADWLQVQVSHFIVMHTIICIFVPVICNVYLHLSTCQSIYRLFDSYRE